MKYGLYIAGLTLISAFMLFQTLNLPDELGLKMKKTTLLIGYGCILFSTYSISCQYHDFGASKIPVFPPLLPELHPVMLQHFKPPQDVPLNLKLTVDETTSSKEGTFTMSYYIHPDYRDVKAEVISSKGVELLGRSTLYLTRVQGDQIIKYRSISENTEKVRVRISAVRRDTPIIVEKQIILASS